MPSATAGPLLLALAYAGGVLTILSPCILPVLPFVFARAGRPFISSILPLLGGMAVTFAGVATLAAVGGGWAVRANEYGRIAAMVLLALFGIALLFPSLADRWSRPLVALGTRLSEHADRGRGAGAEAGASLVLGVAIGLLWAPCAGPILGLLLTGAALRGASAATTLLLLAYALGAATSLAVALLAGRRVYDALKRSLGAGEWIRRALGVAVLAGVVAVATGLDTGLLTRLSLASTAGLEQSLLDAARPGAAAAPGQAGAPTLDVEGPLPPFTGGTLWLGSPPLTPQQLRGKVVLVDFWTYSCINCLRALPYVRAWADKYRDHGLVVIGVHAPEFAFEKNPDNVRRAVRTLGVDYPVVLDNDLAIWRAFRNEYWPADYFIDARGQIRFHQFGEGRYAEGEHVIQQLLAEAGYRDVPGGLVTPDARGAQAAADQHDVRSPETYVGYARAEGFASGPVAADTAHTYAVPATLALNQWALGGAWTIGGESAVLARGPGRLAFRFHARDLHLVLGPASGGTPIRFRVTIDGAAPGDAHGVDCDATGAGEVTTQRLYQLVRQHGAIADHTFEIEFLDPGVHVFSFTFG